MIMFGIGFVSCLVLEGLAMWWVWVYSEWEEQKKMKERLDSRFGRDRFEDVIP